MSFLCQIALIFIDVCLVSSVCGTVIIFLCQIPLIFFLIDVYCVCLCMCVCICVCACVCACVHTCVCGCTHAHTYPHIPTHTHTYPHIPTHTPDTYNARSTTTSAVLYPPPSQPRVNRRCGRRRERAICCQISPRLWVSTASQTMERSPMWVSACKCDCDGELLCDHEWVRANCDVSASNCDCDGEGSC